MIVDEWGAVKVVNDQWISTGVMRIDFQRPHGLIKSADYSIFCQSLFQGQSCIVSGKYSTYFTVSVRNVNGDAANLDFSFQMVGNNY